MSFCRLQLALRLDFFALFSWVGDFSFKNEPDIVLVDGVPYIVSRRLLSYAAVLNSGMDELAIYASYMLCLRWLLLLNWFNSAVVRCLFKGYGKSCVARTTLFPCYFYFLPPSFNVALAMRREEDFAWTVIGVCNLPIALEENVADCK